MTEMTNDDEPKCRYGIEWIEDRKLWVVRDRKTCSIVFTTGDGIGHSEMTDEEAHARCTAWLATFYPEWKSSESYWSVED